MLGSPPSSDRRPFRLGVALGALLTLASGPAASSEPVRGFADVTVIDVGRGTRLPHRDVELRDGAIVRITPAARRGRSPAQGWIDGRGRFLSPGFIDMHAHLNDRVRAQNTAPTLVLADADILSEGHLAIFLAHGVTTLQVMHGSPEMLQLRDRIAAGEIIGPRLVVGSPRLDGLPASDAYVRIAETAAQGAAFVDAAADDGYDFIKIYDGLDAPTYDAVIKRAHERGLRVDGHVARTLPLSHSLQGGQDHIAHVEEFLGYAPNKDAADADRLAAEVKRSGVGVTPTLVVFQHVLSLVEQPGKALSDPRMAYQDPLILALWLPERSSYGSERFRPEPVRQRLHRQFDFMKLMTRALHRAGVPLSVGTDCNVAAAICGFAYHEELAALAGLGLPPADVLGMATLGGARALRMVGRIGEVAPGRAADLVLLTADPLIDAVALQRIDGVMVAGRWLDQAELERRLTRMALRFRRLEARLPRSLRRAP